MILIFMHCDTKLGNFNVEAALCISFLVTFVLHVTFIMLVILHMLSHISISIHIAYDVCYRAIFKGYYFAQTHYLGLQAEIHI